MDAPSLCPKCQQINFDTLRGPTDEDVKAIISNTAHDGRVRLAKAKDGVAYDKVHLGSLESIRKRANTCQLCSLFLDVIQRQGAVYHDSKGQHSVDSNAIYFRADPDLSYFAKIVAQNSDQESAFVLRRLSLTAQEQGTDISVVYIDHAFQLCNVGELARYPSLHRQHGIQSMALAGRKRPDLVDISRVTEWIQICVGEHADLCQPRKTAETPNMETFRVIDVHEKCVREFHDVDISELRFIALSYVWGGTQFLQLKTHNLDQLTRPGALERVDLPATILDSTELVRRLEFRYLWVDGLCIVQDSIPDKSYQIGHMTDVYSLAFLTVVAASGIDASAGLAGLNKPRDLSQREVVVIPPTKDNEGLSILSCLKPHPSKFDEYYTRGQESVDLSKWSHRGWTLQETALPTRKLIFTDEQVFWCCYGAYFCEESRFEVPKLRVKHFNNSVHKITLSAIANEAVDPWTIYDDLVSNFTRRDLTYEGDVGIAFSAVLVSFEERTKTPFLFGIPRSLFELGLMWETSHGVTPRTAISTLPMPASGERSKFPTWSWMGWKGESSCRVSTTRQEMESASVACFIHRRKPLRIEHVNQRSHDLDKAQISKIWDKDEIDSRAVTFDDIQEHIPSLTMDRLEQYPDEQLLFFWTHSATFTIEFTSTSAPASFKDYAEIPIPHLLDPLGEKVGTVCRTRTTAPPSPTLKHTTAEFVQLGMRRDPDIPEEILPPQVLVLQIQRNEYGVAERVNYGEIELNAWEKAAPKACLLALA